MMCQYTNVYFFLCFGKKRFYHFIGLSLFEDKSISVSPLTFLILILIFNKFI